MSIEEDLASHAITRYAEVQQKMSIKTLYSYLCQTLFGVLVIWCTLAVASCTVISR